MKLNIGQVIQLAFHLINDIEQLDVLDTPTDPIRAGNEWFTVTQVAAPKQLPGLASESAEDAAHDESTLHNPG